MLVKELISELEKRIPLNLQQSYDNSGIQIEGPDVEIDKVIVTLDVTEQAVERAIDVGAQIILSHHPLLFYSIKSIKSTDFTGRMVYSSIMNSLTVYSAHTNYDAVRGGLNDILAQKLGMKETMPLLNVGENGDGIGRIGIIDEMEIEEIANFVKERFETDHVKFAPTGPQKIKKIAICSGGGSSLIDEVLKVGVDMYITGDLSYHDILKAVQSGLSLIVVDHDETEKFFEDGMIEILSSLGIKTVKYHERFYWSL